MRRISFLGIIILTIAIGVFVYQHNYSQDDTSSSNGEETSEGVAAFDKKQYSLDDADSTWIIVNKLRPLDPKEYKPSDLVAPDVKLRLSSDQSTMKLRAEAAKAIEEMFTEAKNEGIELMISSAYRSYSYQDSLYKSYVSSQGQSVADTQSARAGYSEHQTGWAVDISAASGECRIEECFGDMDEGKWTANNAYKYGFVLRYPQGKQDVTGYIYEPWHLRYVGEVLAQEIHDQGSPTLEEFFDLPNAPDYK